MVNRESLIKERFQLLVPKLLKSLEIRGYEAVFCESKEEAVKSILSFMPSGTSVTWGGSMTLDEIGIKEELKKHDYVIIDRDTASSPQERVAMMKQAFTTDVYLSSVNAMTEDGEMVNIDATGNRIAAIAYGPETVILVVGMNKVCKDLETARKRARTYAAPNNSLRLQIDSPCTKNGSCADCQSPASICSQIVEMRRNRILGRIKVVIVGEELGL